MDAGALVLPLWTYLLSLPLMGHMVMRPWTDDMIVLRSSATVGPAWVASLAALLDLAYVLALAVTLWATAVGSGLSHRLAEVASAAADRGRFIRIVALDAIVVPLIVFALTRLLDVPEGYAAGLILVGAASAGAIGLAVVRIAHADVPLAIGLVVVLELGNLLTIPVWSSVLLATPVRPPVGDVVATLVLSVLLPLLVGVAVRVLRPDRAQPWAGALARVSAIGFAAVVAVTIARDIGELVDAASAVWVVATVTASAALLLGWFVGYPGRSSRATAALITSVRANAPALAVASGAYGLASDAAAAIVAFALTTLLISGLVSVPLARAQTGGRAERIDASGGDHAVP